MIRMSLSSFRSRLFINDSYEGEQIETKIERVMTLNEPISDTAPIIYTKRSDGVEPQYNIRTDRFDVALEAMDKVQRSYTARREDRAADMKVQKGGKSEGGQSESGADSGGGDAGADAS